MLKGRLTWGQRQNDIFPPSIESKSLTHTKIAPCFVAVLQFLPFRLLSVKKTGMSDFIRSNVLTKPEQKYCENRRILKVLLYTNMTLIPGCVNEGRVIDLSF